MSDSTAQDAQTSHEAERQEADLAEVAAAMARLARSVSARGDGARAPDDSEPAETSSASAVEEVQAPRPSQAPDPVRIGVLLVNLGTPDGADTNSVRRYLTEFLSDPRVIEKDTWWWRFVLNNIILRFRPARSARNYRKVWNRERDESPLMTITRDQAESLAERLRARAPSVTVDWAMRYGNPPIRERLFALAQAGCERILLAPLYPQYAAATTATVCDEAFRALLRMRWQPTLRVAPPYFSDPGYIEALAQSIETHLRGLPFEPDVVLTSFHGIPREYVDAGDPYADQCARTTELLRQRLGMDESKLVLTFQSRFGRAEWLKPYTDETVKSLAKRGVKSLVIATPGFSADCLETLEEIAGENREIFEKYGGHNFSATPCLNASDTGMRMIQGWVLRELQGWI